MVRSMSGHGRGEASSGTAQVTVEVRTVNHRFCHISLRFPSDLQAFEDCSKRAIQERVRRGKVDLTVSIYGASNDGARIDTSVASQYLDEIRRLAAALDIPEEVDAATLVTLPGVVTDGSGRARPAITSGDDEASAAVGVLLDEALTRALDGLEAIRAAEGVHLAGDLRTRLATMADAVSVIEQAAAGMVPRVRDQLTERIAELLGDGGGEVDSDRLQQEVVFYADRADITEEIVRLQSHLAKLDGLLSSDESVGRTLEFVIQEVHRELNTIGSKARDAVIADTVVELKSELERVREQVQNLE